MRARQVPFLLTALCLAACRPSPALDFEQKLVYFGTNLQNNGLLDQYIARLGEFKQAGYNGVLLADWPVSHLKLAQPQYPANVAKFMAEARRLGMEVIPAVFAVGWSNGLLMNDVNLASGLPVRNASFKVTAGEARPVMPAETALRNGGFESPRGDQMSGWSWQDEPGKITFADPQTVHGGTCALRLERTTPGGDYVNARVVQRLKVRPHQTYHLSLWIKTEGFDQVGSVHAQFLSDEARQAHTYNDLNIKRTQDWTEHHVVFNTLAATDISLYLGCWGIGKGKLWLDDLRLEPAGLLNVVRRDLCPLKVTTEDGATVYEEGRDFEPVKDPLLGQDERGLSNYSVWHEPPAIKLTANSRIQDGATVAVSWFHAMVIYTDSVPVSLEDPKVFDLLREEIAGAHKLFGATGYMMSYDEWRCGGWETDLDVPMGRKLAAHVKQAAQIVREAAPGATVYVWNDMFDPNHNAVDHYYLVNGSLAGSWEGLDKDTVIVNWNLGRFGESAKFFSDRGHRQVIAGYYDAPPERLGPLLAVAAKTPGVTGLMYTTWENNYRDLASYLAVAAGWRG